MELVTNRRLVDKCQGVIARARCSEPEDRFPRSDSLSRCTYYLAQRLRWLRRS